MNSAIDPLLDDGLTRFFQYPMNTRDTNGEGEKKTLK